MGTVTNSLVQNNWITYQQPDPLLVTILVILTLTFRMLFDQIVGYCSVNLGSGSWLLFLLFWISLLATLPIILDQAFGYSSHYF
jgi:hydrogenase-4 membrane subunit HyfE